MLSVTYRNFMLSVAMLNVVMLSVVEPKHTSLFAPFRKFQIKMFYKIGPMPTIEWVLRVNWPKHILLNLQKCFFFQKVKGPTTTQGTLTEADGLVLMTSSLRSLVFLTKVDNIISAKMNLTS